MRYAILSTAWMTVLWTAAIMVWVHAGPDDLPRIWEWQWRDYRAFYDRHLGDFFAYEATPYLTVLYVVAGIFILLLACRLLSFLA